MTIIDCQIHDLSISQKGGSGGPTCIFIHGLQGSKELFLDILKISFLEADSKNSVNGKVTEVKASGKKGVYQVSVNGVQNKVQVAASTLTPLVSKPGLGIWLDVSTGTLLLIKGNRLVRT